MVRVSVLYPHTANTKFDMVYYLNHHITMVQRLLGPALKGVSVEQGISGEEPGSLPPYRAIAHLLFDSVQDFQSSFAPHVEEIMGDVPKYTIGEIKL